MHIIDGHGNLYGMHCCVYAMTVCIIVNLTYTSCPSRWTNDGRRKAKVLPVPVCGVINTNHDQSS